MAARTGSRALGGAGAALDDGPAACAAPPHFARLPCRRRTCDRPGAPGPREWTGDGGRPVAPSAIVGGVRLPIVAVVACLVAAAATSCSRAPEEHGAAAHAPAAATPELPWPRARRVLVADLTPEDKRPLDLSLAADTAVRKAILGPEVFAPAAPEDDGACDVSVELMYALLSNGEVDPTATQGTARIAMEADLVCPEGGAPDGAVETFRAAFDQDLPFGGSHEITGEAALRAILDALARRAAGALYGQVAMRHARDDELLASLRDSQHTGILMEAAAEVGERKLRGAVEHLIRLTAHDEPVVVLRAGAALGLLGDARPEALAALARMTEGSDPERHLIAINALGDIGGPEAARYLQTLAVGHPSAPMREAARMAADRARGREAP